MNEAAAPTGSEFDRIFPQPTIRLDHPRLDAFHLLQRDARLAAEAVGTVVTTGHRFADHTLTIHAVGEAVADVFGPALAHNRIDPDPDADLTITAFSGDTSGIELNGIARAALDQSHTMRPDRRHEVVALRSDELFAAFRWPVLSLFERATHRGLWYVDRLDLLRVWDVAAPGRELLNWWLNGFGAQLVHAAAVGVEDAAVLVTGRGGSGKSTLALSCIGSELRYLGDDYCAVRLEPDPTVMTLYNSGKMVGQEDIDRLPHLERWIVNPDELGDMKQMVFAHQIDPTTVLNSAPLRAIVLPTIVAEGAPEVSEISRNEALRALAPTSMLQLPGTGSGDLRAMADLVRRLPCFQLTVGPDLDANRAALAAFVDTLPR